MNKKQIKKVSSIINHLLRAEQLINELLDSKLSDDDRNYLIERSEYIYNEYINFSNIEE